MKNDNAFRDSPRNQNGLFSSVKRTLLWAIVVITLFALLTIVAPLVMSEQPYMVTWIQLMEEGRGIRLIWMIGVASAVVGLSFIVRRYRKS